APCSPRPRRTATPCWAHRSSASRELIRARTGRVRKSNSPSPRALPRPQPPFISPYVQERYMRTPSRRRPPRATLALAAAGTLLAPLLSGCWVGAGGSGSGGNSINVLMVNNPQMVELQKLTAAHFTKETGIKVNFTVLP